MVAEAHAPAEQPEITVVVPVLDEVDSLAEMHGELARSLGGLGRAYEIVFVDDGSRDGSAGALDALARGDANVRVVHLRKNFGKSPALAAGFDVARGSIVLTLDGDLQDDPAMIPEFVARIEAGADLVSGWKRVRHDPLGKRVSSRLFNLVVRLVSGVRVRDVNCGFKAYRAECLRELSVYGGFHRFLPVLAAERGFVVAEIEVRHRERRHGRSKYGVGRLFDGLLDLLTVLMVTRFRTRPAHLFGLVGGVSGVVGIGILVYLSALWFSNEPIGTRPLLTLGVLLTIAAIQFIAIGLVAELLVRTTVTSREIYSIRSRVGFDDTPAVAPAASQRVEGAKDSAAPKLAAP